MWHGADSCDLIELFDVNLLVPFLLWPGKKSEFCQSVAREKNSQILSFCRDGKNREMCRLVARIKTAKFANWLRDNITKFGSRSQKNRKIVHQLRKQKQNLSICRRKTLVKFANRSRENIAKFVKQSWKKLAKFVKRAQKKYREIRHSVVTRNYSVWCRVNITNIIICFKKPWNSPIIRRKHCKICKFVGKKSWNSTISHGKMSQNSWVGRGTWLSFQKS